MIRDNPRGQSHGTLSPVLMNTWQGATESEARERGETYEPRPNGSAVKKRGIKGPRQRRQTVTRLAQRARPGHSIYRGVHPPVRFGRLGGDEGKQTPSALHLSNVHHALGNRSQRCQFGGTPIPVTRSTASNQQRLCGKYPSLPEEAIEHDLLTAVAQTDRRSEGYATYCISQGELARDTERG